MKSSRVLILSLGLITVLSVSKAKPFREELNPRDIGDAIEFDDGWLTKKKGEFFLSEITNSNTKCTPFCHISAVVDLSAHSMLYNF